jgi:hypothetical protein
MYVAIISSCASALINRPISYLFDILTSTTASTQASSNQVSPQPNDPEQFEAILPTAATKRRAVNLLDISQARVSYHQKQKFEEKRGVGISSLVTAAMEVTESELREIPEEIIDMYHEIATDSFSMKKLFSSVQSNIKTSANVPNVIVETTKSNSFFARSFAAAEAINPVTLEFSMSPFTLFQNSLLSQFQVLLNYPDERREYQSLWGHCGLRNVEQFENVGIICERNSNCTRRKLSQNPKVEEIENLCRTR